MEHIYLSKENIQNLPFLSNCNSNEAYIFNYNEKELIKLFYFLSNNKIYTLELIDRYYQDFKLIPELLFHKKYIYDYSKLIGILLQKGYNLTFHNFLNQKDIVYNDIIIVLQNIGKVLEQLKNIREKENKLTTFFIGDMHERNILVDKNSKKVQFIDLDSCKLEDNLASMTKYLEFLKTYNYIKTKLNYKYPYDKFNFSNNENTDLYCYMVMILKHLFGVNIIPLDLNEFYNQMYFLKEQGLPEDLYQIFINLYNNIPNTNPYKLLDGIPSSFERRRTL